MFRYIERVCALPVCIGDTHSKRGRRANCLCCWLCLKAHGKFVCNAFTRFMSHWLYWFNMNLSCAWRLVLFTVSSILLEIYVGLTGRRQQLHRQHPQQQQTLRANVCTWLRGSQIAAAHARDGRAASNAPAASVSGGFGALIGCQNFGIAAQSQQACPRLFLRLVMGPGVERYPRPRKGCNWVSPQGSKRNSSQQQEAVVADSNKVHRSSGISILSLLR